MFAAAAHATKANVPNVVFSSLKASSSSSSKSSSFVTSKKSSISTSISRQKNTVVISRRISVRVSATNASSSSSAEERWQSMNVSLPNLRDNLDRSTTRNIDGKVYTLTLSAEDLPLVSDKFSQEYDARVSKAGIIEANLDGKRITDDDLVGTIGMATPETITFTPRLDNTQGQSIGKSISNKRYDFYYYETPTADSPTLIFSNIRLVPVDAEGKTFKLEKSDDKFLKGIKVMKTGTTTSGAFDMTLIGKQGFVQTFEFNDDTTTDPMIVHISQSEESNNLRGHEKVIMIKQIINDVDYYLFGDHFDLLGSKTNSDDFFKRNIYITDSSTS